jgi:hypothetical protein
MNDILDITMEDINKTICKEYGKLNSFENYKIKLKEIVTNIDITKYKEFYDNYKNVYHKLYIEKVNNNLSTDNDYLSHEEYAKILQDYFIKDEEDEYVLYMIKHNPWEYKQHYKNKYELQYKDYERKFIIDKLTKLKDTNDYLLKDGEFFKQKFFTLRNYINTELEYKLTIHSYIIGFLIIVNIYNWFY